MLDSLHHDSPFVAFVGAGASALPPSSLPTWNGFNSLLLQCLCERLSTFSNDRAAVDAILSRLEVRRDRTRFFGPDFQAQLIEDQIGDEYFDVWQSLRTSAFGPVHAGLAELAERGRLAAIITTNFDQLIEAALTRRGVPFRVAHDHSSFAASSTAGIHEAGPLPVIKIHGSLEDPPSLVDTLRQRVAGRPETLQGLLDGLLRERAWLYLGYSGADFGYDDNYLNVLHSAPEAKGFVFLARPGARVQDGVRRLVEAYGPRAAVEFGDLATWLSEQFELAPVGDHDREAAPGGSGGEDVVKPLMAEWVAGRGNMSVVNILFSMLRSAGLEADALWLMRKTFRSYRSAADSMGTSYARYNLNHGAALLEVGSIRNTVTLADDQSNLLQWKEQADRNAYEFLARSYREGALPVAGVHLAALLAYRGQMDLAIPLASEATDRVIAGGGSLALCDAAIAGAPIFDILQMFQAPIASFRHALQVALRMGDEPRRAMLCVLLGRFLTYAHQFPEASGRLDEADRIVDRLDLGAIRLASTAARGLWLAESGTSAPDAVRVLQEANALLQALDSEPLFTKVDLLDREKPPEVVMGVRPLRCRVLLDLNRAALLSSDGSVLGETLDALDELATERFQGYCPHYYLAYAECLLEEGDPQNADLAQDLIRRARHLGETGGNPWVAEAARALTGPG